MYILNISLIRDRWRIEAQARKGVETQGTEATNFCTSGLRAAGKHGAKTSGGGRARLSQAKNAREKRGANCAESRARMVNSCWCLWWPFCVNVPP